jgi:hypothetical protein
VTGRQAAVLAAVVSACAGLLSCLDAAGPGRMRGSLAVYPVFDESGVLNGAPSDVDSIYIAVVHPNPPPDSIRLGRRIEPGQTEIRIELQVPLRQAEQQFVYSFQAIRTSDGMVLYAGVDTVTVRLGPPSAPEPFVPEYVGPGRNIRSIDIVPGSASLGRGDTLRFDFVAIDSNDAVITGMPVVWRSTNADIVVVDQAGLALARQDGTAGVVVISGARTSVQDTAVVQIGAGPPPIASVAVAPGFGVVTVGGTMQLGVTARDGAGNTVPAGSVSFTSRSAGVASVSTAGVVTGVSGGTATIVATASGVSDSMLVAVAADSVAVAAPVADARFFGEASAGDTVRVQMGVDIRGAAPEKLGSYNARLTWTTGQLRFVRTETAGAFGAPVTNPDSTSVGVLRFSAADANGATGPAILLLTAVYVAEAAGSTPLALTLTDLSATGPSFLQMLPKALVLSSSVRVR